MCSVKGNTRHTSAPLSSQKFTSLHQTCNSMAIAVSMSWFIYEAQLRSQAELLTCKINITVDGWKKGLISRLKEHPCQSKEYHR